MVQSLLCNQYLRKNTLVLLVSVLLLSQVHLTSGQQDIVQSSGFEEIYDPSQAHELQSPLPYPMDSFEDVNHQVMLSKKDVESMYLVEHYRVTELSTAFAEKVIASQKRGNMIEWEPWVKKLRGYQNEERNWEFFWDSLTPETDENGKPVLPEKGSKLYDLIQKSFGDYERMREHYLETVGVSSDFFQRGQRAESRLNYEKTSGWIWVLYDQVENKLVINSTNQDKLSYLDGTGNGLLHPILAIDKILACSVDDVHYIINWKKAADRLEEVMKREYVLITGGLGYIGSHTVVELVKGENQHVIIIDNLNNAKIISMNRVKVITGRPNNFVFHQIDLRNKEQLENVIFKQYKIKSVIHFAALKSVGESMSKPLEYYHNNVGSTIQLLMLMRDYGVRTLVFSSSATVYGDNPLSDENSQIQPINPYGQTKAMIEQVMNDYAASKPEVLMIALRYFNPIGAHESGLIGEDPNDIPNNLMPYIQKVASGHLPILRVFGNDYETPDGTGVRDYIHVTDLAKGHIAALKKENELKGYQVFNLGTGTGTTVFQMKDAFQKASGVEIKFEIHPRRAGDARQVLAIPDRANKVLEWKTELSVMDACGDAWRWVKMNPNGYEEQIEEQVL